MTGAVQDEPAARASRGRHASIRRRLVLLARRVIRLPERTLAGLIGFVLRWALRFGLPLAGAAAVLHTFPYQARVQGVPFRVQGSLFERSYISADTTLGNWVFPHVDGLPIGIHVSPVDVNLLQLARDASGDTGNYVERLRADFTGQLPRIVLWLGAELLIGLLLGLAMAAAINMSVRYLRRLPRRDRELWLRGRQLAAAALVVAVLGGYGVATYEHNWARQSRLTGTLAAAQLFPSQLQQYYQQQSKPYDVVNAIIGIQGTLQSQFQQRNAAPTAFPIMFISDLHLAATYPLVRQYALNYGVKLIVNTGDESEFGKRAELTPTYLAEMTDLTRTIPMVWLAGNHDSPEIEATMRRVPGVIVLGGKTTRPDGSIATSADALDAFGLTIAGLPDPRVYGGPGVYGSDKASATDPLERSDVDAAGTGLTDSFDIFAVHEPVAADRLRADLPDRIRQTNSGHLHAQNKTSDIQHKTAIDLVEGSTGAGGLDNIGRSTPRPPIEFSIESVAANCQFTRVQRFSINAQAAADASAPQRFGDDAVVSTVYFTPQDLPGDRLCSTAFGIGTVRPLLPGSPDVGGRAESPSPASASPSAQGGRP
jgi:predicted MPP superfamily phosphohydrolase